MDSHSKNKVLISQNDFKAFLDLVPRYFSPLLFQPLLPLWTLHPVDPPVCFNSIPEADWRHASYKNFSPSHIAPSALNTLLPSPSDQLLLIL